MALKACLGKRCRAGQINHFVRVTTTNNYLGITSIRVITHFMCLATDIALYMCVYNFPSPFFFFFPPGKNMRSRWWCVSTCPKNRRTAKREAWCPCRACWAVSHTSVTSQHWQEARAGRWACSDITKESYFTYWARLKHCWWGNIWIYQLKSMFRVGVERYLMGVSLRWRKALVKESRLTWLLALIIKPLGQPPADSKCWTELIWWFWAGRALLCAYTALKSLSIPFPVSINRLLL